MAEVAADAERARVAALHDAQQPARGHALQDLYVLEDLFGGLIFLAGDALAQFGDERIFLGRLLLRGLPRLTLRGGPRLLSGVRLRLAVLRGGVRVRGGPRGGERHEERERGGELEACVRVSVHAFRLLPPS